MSERDESKTLDQMTPQERVKTYESISSQIATLEYVKRHIADMIMKEVPDGSEILCAGWVAGLDVLFNWLDQQSRMFASNRDEVEQAVKRDQLASKMTKRATEFKPMLPTEPVPVIVPEVLAACTNPECLAEVGTAHDHVVKADAAPRTEN